MILSNTQVRPSRSLVIVVGGSSPRNLRQSDIERDSTHGVGVLLAARSGFELAK